MSMVELDQPGDARPLRDSRSEDMFLAWLLRLPDTVDIAEAARIEIARLDAIKSDCDVTIRLRGFLLQASENCFALPRGRSRSRH